MLYAFYKINPQLRKKSIFDKFDGMGVPKITLYSWLALLEQRDDLKHKPGQGRRKVLATTVTVKKIIYHFNHRAGRSRKKCAKKFNMHQSYVSHLLHDRTMVRNLKRTNRPKMTAFQKKYLKLS